MSHRSLPTADNPRQTADTLDGEVDQLAPEPFDRAGREVLGEDIGLLHHLLDEHQASSRSQVRT
jgi:hypothetical protein